MNDEQVHIRGTGEGLIISLGEGAFDQVLTELESRLAARASFFRGGRVALQVGERTLSVVQLEALGGALQAQGVSLWAVEGSHPITQNSARELGLEIRINMGPSAQGSLAASKLPADLLGVVIHRTLRSGQSAEFAGHITLIGDVHAGAEVVAAGDVIIWGKLRGTVHAGVSGDDDAVVCALQLAPTLLRIGTHVARSPERARPPKHPEIARVVDDQIVVERWNARYPKGR
jgi:septum site-determining protein MinC